MAKIPATKAVKNATSIGKNGIDPRDSGEDINSYVNEATIMGMDMRKENSAASSRLVPVAKAADIVAPERLIPGITAIP